jgi:uncharacterized protein DUF4153
MPPSNAGEPAADRAAPACRPLFAWWALVAAALLGILADLLLRDGLSALGLLLWMLLFSIAVLTLARRHDRRLSAESRTWLAIALLAAVGSTWHDAPELQFFDLLALLTALVLLAMSSNAMPVSSLALARVRDLIRTAFGTAVGVATGVVPLMLRDAELNAARRPAGGGSVRRISQALLITLPLLALFSLLLTRADPLFGSLLRFPAIDLGVAFSHVAIAAIFAWMVAGWLRRTFFASPGDIAPERPLPFALSTTDVTFALGTLNLLFAAFVIVQVGWLFGGEALVHRTTGLSYANYARHGFFELTGVAALLLPLLLAAQALIPAEDLRTLRFYRRLALPLVVLLGAIIASAGARMQLYVQYYGISADRLYATAFMSWLAIVFVLLGFTLLRGRPRTFATGFVISGFVVLFALNCLNPDALVARANLARGAATHAGATGTDLPYITSLGGDAVPLLVAALSAPAAAGDSAAVRDRCTAARVLLAQWGEAGEGRRAGGWTQWSVARSRAVEAVESHAAALRQLACPPTIPVS